MVPECRIVRHMGGFRHADGAHLRTVLRTERPSTLLEHGPACSLRPGLSVQGICAGESSRSDMVHVGPGYVRVRVVRHAEPGRAGSVQGHGVADTPDVHSLQLFYAGHLDHLPVFHGRPLVRHEPGRHHQQLPVDHQQPVDPRVRFRVQLAGRLDLGLHNGIVHIGHKRFLLDNIRLLPGHHVLRVKRTVPKDISRVRDDRPPVAVTVAELRATTHRFGFGICIICIVFVF